MTTPDQQKVLDAMRSGEWLRAQWIARVAFDLGSAPWQPALGARARRALKVLAEDRLVERREAVEHRTGDVEGASPSRSTSLVLSGGSSDEVLCQRINGR